MSQDPAVRVCPYLRGAQDKIGGQYEPTQERHCHATAHPFAPSAVQQSSCCLNSAIFARCPYYVAALGEAQQGAELHKRLRRRVGLFAQIRQLFAFGQKKKKRVYYT